MPIFDSFTVGPGFTTDRLTPRELSWTRKQITEQYLERLASLQPDLSDDARRQGLANYHLLPIQFDHGESWNKASRLLDPSYVEAFTQMGFFRRIQKEFGPSAQISHDELNWRLVRPNHPEDVGPVHADKWFWDAGYGFGSMQPGYDRFKIWIAIHTEPGLNGLTVKPGSHRVQSWKHHFESRHGVRKPVLDEDESKLDMELLHLKPGELVMFHDELLHGGCVNRGEQCRVSLELTVLFDRKEAETRKQKLQGSTRRSWRRISSRPAGTSSTA